MVNTPLSVAKAPFSFSSPAMPTSTTVQRQTRDADLPGCK